MSVAPSVVFPILLDSLPLRFFFLPFAAAAGAVLRRDDTPAFSAATRSFPH